MLSRPQPVRSGFHLGLGVDEALARIGDAALESLRLPRKLDLFWISQNYHDLHDKFFGPVDIVAFNKAVFDALKPGGSYIVLDHTAAPGAPTDVTETLHRIDPDLVRREVEAAGFVFDSESQILANPADPREQIPG
jgi:predicted methyltransferase